MTTNNRILRARLTASASAVMAFFGGYGRAFAQTVSASNCTAQADGSYLCSGVATTTQSISLGSGNSSGGAGRIAMTTSDGFSVNVQTPSDRGINLWASDISFTDTHHATINSDHNYGLFVRGAGPITVTSNGTISGSTGIQAYSYNSSTASINITTSGKVSGNRDGQGDGSGIHALLGAASTKAITINAADVEGQNYGIWAQNNGTGSISITTTGTVATTPTSINGAGAGIWVLNNLNGRNTAGGDGSDSTLSITSSGTVTGRIVAENRGLGLTSVKISGTVGSQMSADNLRLMGYSYDDGYRRTPGVAVTGAGAVDAEFAATSTVMHGIDLGAASALTVTLDGKVNDAGPDQDIDRYGKAAVQLSGTSAAVTVNGTIIGKNEGSGISVGSAGDIALTVNQGAHVEGNTGLFVEQPGHTPTPLGLPGGSGKATLTISGAVIGNGGTGSAISPVTNQPYSYAGIVIASPGRVHSDQADQAAQVAANSQFTINVTSSGTISGPAGIRIAHYDTSVTDYVTSAGAPIAITNSGTITGGIIADEGATQKVTITNTGTISAASGSSTAISLTGPNSVINLQGGAVNGDIVIAQHDVADGAPTINWTGGTVKGGITLSTETVTGGAVNYPASVNLTGLGEEQLSGLTHIMLANPGTLPNGIPLVNLHLDNTQFRGGSFDADDTSKGVNLPAGQVNAIDLTNGSTFTMTGGLRLSDGGDYSVRIDPTSTLRVASVNPNNSASFRVENNGTFDLTGTGTPGNTINVYTYTQSATGKLIVGVTPTQIDVLTAAAGAKIAGTVVFAWGPGTYTAGSRAFLTAGGYGAESYAVTGTFSQIAAAPGTTAPAGFKVDVAYASQSASLVLSADTGGTGDDGGSTTPPDEPPPPVVVAPADATLFSEQIAGFLASNETRAIELLGRVQPDGGGNSFFNPDIGEPHRARIWMEGTGHTLGAGFRASSAGTQFGGDLGVGASGRIGAAIAYERSWLSDGAGGTGSGDSIHASLYASQPLGPVGVSAVFTYSHAWNKTRRPTGVGTASADRGLTAYTGGVQVSAPIAVRGALLTPAVGVLATRVEADAFRETGGGLPGFAVAGLDHDKTFVSPFASLGFSYALTGHGGVTWVPEAEIGYRRSDVASGVGTTLVSDDGTLFPGNRAALDRNVVRAGAGLSAHQGRWTAYIKYRAEVSDGWTDHSGAVGLRLAL